MSYVNAGRQQMCGDRTCHDPNNVRGSGRVRFRDDARESERGGGVRQQLHFCGFGCLRGASFGEKNPPAGNGGLVQQTRNTSGSRVRVRVYED